MRKKVYLNDTICESARKRLEAKVDIIDNFDHPEELDAIIVRQQYCPREVIAKAKKCRLIQMHGVGLERIDVDAAREYGIPVERTKGGNAQSVAELAIGFMITMARKMKFLNNGLLAGRFHTFGLPETVGTELSGKRLGLIGGGQIAQLVANIARLAFHCDVLVYDPFLPEEKAAALGFTKVEKVTELAAQADFVSIHVPYTESTHHMVGREFFAAANPRLILVNMARVGIVWFPTVDAANDAAYKAAHAADRALLDAANEQKKPGQPKISVLDENGRLQPAVYPVLEAIREQDMILATGHIAPRESLALLQAAADMGLHRLLVTHASLPMTQMTLALQRECTALGAFIEHCCYTPYHDLASWDEIASAVREIGPARIVLSTDFGQSSGPDPAKGLARFARELMARGISGPDIRQMTVTNPRRLLL